MAGRSHSSSPVLAAFVTRRFRRTAIAVPAGIDFKVWGRAMSDRFVARKGGTVIPILPPLVEDSRRRVVIVYRNTLLRDLLARALGEGGLAVTAVADDELDGLVLERLEPDVIVFEDAKADFVQAACELIVMSPASTGVKKVIVIGREYLITVSFRKEIVQDASMEDLLVRTHYSRALDDLN